MPGQILQQVAYVATIALIFTLLFQICQSSSTPGVAFLFFTSVLLLLLLIAEKMVFEPTWIRLRDGGSQSPVPREISFELGFSMAQQQEQSSCEMLDSKHARFVMDDFHDQIVQSNADLCCHEFLSVGRHELWARDLASLCGQRILTDGLLDAYLDLVGDRCPSPRIESVDASFANLLRDMEYKRAARSYGLSRTKRLYQPK